MSAKQKKYTRFTAFTLLPALLLALALAAPAFLLSGGSAGALSGSQWETVRGYIQEYASGAQYNSGLEGEAGFRMSKTGTTGLWSRLDSNGNINPAPGTATGAVTTVTGVVGEGDDMANRPVLIDNLRTLTTIIPGTEFRCNWNTGEDCFSDASLTAIRGLVDRHQAAGFSTDIVDYCVSSHTAAPSTGGFGIIAQVPGALASDTSLTPNVYMLEWSRNGWRDNVSNTAGSNPIGSPESSAGGFSAPSTSTCGSTTNDYDLVRCQANWAIDASGGNVGNGQTAIATIQSAGQSVDIRTGSISTMSTAGTNLQIPINTLFSASGLADIDPSKSVVMATRTQMGGIAAIGLEMLGYNNIAGGFIDGGIYRWNSSLGEPQPDAGVGLPLQTISSYGSASLVETTAPTQSGINSQSVTSSSAVIERDASEPATMKVAYGTTSGGPYTSTENNTVLNQTDKQVTLGGLSEYTTYYYVVTSYDGYANASTTSSEGSFTTLDGTPPVTTDDAPAGWQTANFTVTLNCADSGSGCASTWYRVDGSGSFVSGTSVAINTDGNHLIEYYSKDVANNTETTKTVYAKLDKTAPATTDDAPSGWQTADFTVTLNCADSGSGCASTWYRVDGSGSFVSGTSVAINTDGNHLIEYYSKDVANNTETTKTVYAKLDKTAPATTDDAPSGWQTADVNVTLSCSDATSGCATTEYRTSTDGGATWGSWQTGTAVAISTDGTHDIEYRSTDNAGNVESVQTATVQLDKTPPVTTDDAPSGWQTADVTVNFTCLDALSGCDYTEYSLDAGTTWTLDTTPLVISADGVHDIKYRSRDLAGNTESINTATVQLDKTAPTISGQQPSGTIYTAGPAIEADLVDPTSGIDTAQSGIYLDGSGTKLSGCGFTDIANGKKISCPVSGLAYGPHSFTVETRDNAGHAGNSGPHAFSVGDNVAPTVNYVEPTGTINTDSTTIKATYTDPEPSSALDTTYASTVSLNGGAPLPCITGGGNVTCGVSGLDDGVYSAAVTVTDNDGNSGSATGGFTVNTQAPTVTPDPIGYQPGNWTNDATPDLSATISDVPDGQDILDGGVIIDSNDCDGAVSYSNTSVSCTPATPLGEGPHSVKYWAEYSPNNPGEGLQTINIDLTPPVVSSIQPSGWQTSAAVTVAADLTNTGSGVNPASAVVEVDGSPLSGCTTSPITGGHHISCDATGLDEGNHTIDVSVNDNAGNEGAGSGSFDVDTVAPATTDDAPSGWQTADVNVTLSCSDATSGCAATQYRTSTDGGATWSSWQTGTAVAVNTDGTHDIEYRSTDNAGNVESVQTATVQLDKTPPVTTDDAPSGWQTADVTVNFTCLDALSGCDYTEYSLDAGTTWTLDTTPLVISADGVHDIKYRSRDLAGNTESINTATVQLDKTAPATTDDAPSGWQTADFTVTLSCSDATSGCAATQYRTSTDGGATWGSWQTGTAVAVNTDGTHDIEYRSTDAAGNVESVQTATVQLDKTAPVTTDDAPAGPQFYPFTVTLNCSDAASGCASTQYRVDSGGGFGDWQTGNTVDITDAGTYTIEYYSNDNAGHEESPKSVEVTRTLYFPITGLIKVKWDALNEAPGKAISEDYDIPGGSAQDFEDGRLIHNYIAGQVFWVRGAILEKYDDLDGPEGFLGLPTSDRKIIPGGQVTDFQNGKIYWSPATGAHEVHGAILGKYLALGGPGGFLGFPKSDEYGVTGGRASNFQGANGRIYWSPATGPREVHGAILARYDALGGPDSFLKLPVSDEYSVPGGRASNFQGANGRIYWSPAPGVGAHEVHGAILGKYLALGGPGGWVGFPVSEEEDSACCGGKESHFQHASIYWSSATGAHEVHGAILGKYRQAGMMDILGMPTTDEYGVPGGRAGSFQKGRIYWSPAPGVGAHEVHGVILGKYFALGGPGGFLGFPKSDEYDVPGGRASNFQGGHIYYSNTLERAHEVHGAILAKYLSLGGPSNILGLGLPTSDEFPILGGRRSNFANGHIWWKPGLGANVVYY